jgi:hypothetical protein
MHTRIWQALPAAPSGSTGLRPLADGRTPEPLRLLLALLLVPPLTLLWALGPSRAAVMAAIAALNSCVGQQQSNNRTEQQRHYQSTGAGRL